MTVRIEKTYTGPSRQDWRSIAADVGIGPVIYIAPGFQWQSLAYYRNTAYNAYPIWQSDINKIAQGADPVPARLQRSDGLLIAQNGTPADTVLLPAFKRYFDVEGRKQFAGGFTTYNLHPLAGSAQATQ